MSQSVALLVGGTKVLEKALQLALPSARHVVAATMEEATASLGSGEVRLLIIGPTMRRGLQAVTTLRQGGSTDPKILVVYRDDQRDEVKRHQKTKAIADRYVVQSRIGKELNEAATVLWSDAPGGADFDAIEEDDLEEIGKEAVEEMDDGEEIALGADDVQEDQPPPIEEVLGEFDATAFERGLDTVAQAQEQAVEVLEDAQFEEVLGGDDVELAGEEIELDGAEAIDDAADGEETLEAADWVEDGELATEPIEPAAEIVEEVLEAEAIDDEGEAGEGEAGDDPATQAEPEVQADTTLTPTPAAIATPLFSAANPPRTTASYRAATVETIAQGQPVDATHQEPRRSPSSMQVADDLSGIVGRLQEMSHQIARLETENEALRATALEKAAAAADSEARGSAAERRAAAHDGEVARLRTEVQVSRAQVAALEARLAAQHQASAAAAQGLRDIAATLAP